MKTNFSLRASSSFAAFVLAAAIVCSVSQMGQADTIAYPNAAQTTGNQTNGDTSLGMDFQVNHEIKVTQIGAFDSGQNGFANDVIVELYKVNETNNTGTLVAGSQVTFDPTSNPGTAVGNNRFDTLSTPLILQPGNDYSIVYYNITGNNEAFYNFGHSNGSSGGNTDGGAITFIGDSRFGGGGNTFPTNIDGTGGNSTINYQAGTFAFTAVPEPTSLILCGLGAVGLFWAARRRRRA